MLLAGQSLSLGLVATPPISTTPLADAWMFAQGVDAYTVGGALKAISTLVENGAGGAGETPASGIADNLLQPSLLSSHGLSAAQYDLIKKGAAPYAAGLAQVDAGLALVPAIGTYAFGGVVLIHGETDNQIRWNDDTYQADLIQFQADYEADIQAKVGAVPVPLMISQLSSWTAAACGGVAQSRIPICQYKASKANPTGLPMLGPKYFLAHVGADGVHMTSASSRRLGAYAAKAIRAGSAWRPLWPTLVQRAGAVITATFNVPVAPLVLDTVLVTDPGSYGFEFTDDSGSPPAISSVALQGTTQVVITLASTPTGANKLLRYAYTGTAGNNGGPTTGPRGCLRDSDPDTDRDGSHLYNWCVHFEEACP